MFGINKCFGGSEWGVIAVTEDYELAVDIVKELKKDGGMYNVKNMFVVNSRRYFEDEFKIKLTIDNS